MSPATTARGEAPCPTPPMPRCSNTGTRSPGRAGSAAPGSRRRATSRLRALLQGGSAATRRARARCPAARHRRDGRSLCCRGYNRRPPGHVTGGRHWPEPMLDAGAAERIALCSRRRQHHAGARRRTNPPLSGRQLRPGDLALRRDVLRRSGRRLHQPPCRRCGRGGRLVHGGVGVDGRQNTSTGRSRSRSSVEAFLGPPAPARPA